MKNYLRTFITTQPTSRPLRVPANTCSKPSKMAVGIKKCVQCAIYFRALASKPAPSVSMWHPFLKLATFSKLVLSPQSLQSPIAQGTTNKEQKKEATPFQRGRLSLLPTLL